MHRPAKDMKRRTRNPFARRSANRTGIYRRRPPTPLRGQMRPGRFSGSAPGLCVDPDVMFPQERCESQLQGSKRVVRASTEQRA